MPFLSRLVKEERREKAIFYYIPPARIRDSQNSFTWILPSV